MKTPKIESGKFTNPSETEDDTSVENSKSEGIGRRLLGTIFPKRSNQKLNPNRRIMSNDRRTISDRRRTDIEPDYEGPTSRYTIDRRLNLKDRRKKD